MAKAEYLPRWGRPGSSSLFISAMFLPPHRLFYFIYGRRAEVRPQFRMRLWLDNYSLAAAEKRRHLKTQPSGRPLCIGHVGNDY